MDPAAIQSDFAAALHDPSPDAVPTGFSDVAARRFRVYRNNVRIALIEALGAAYPAVLRLVGIPFFEQMARVYIEACPARQRTLNLYGDGFDDFVGGFGPARGLPYLADVARLERAVLEACHAADAPALDPVLLTALGPGLASARLTPHPATRLVRSAYPIADIWHANNGDSLLEDELVLANTAAGALVMRPGFSVSVEALASGQCTFVETLLAGDNLAAANAAAVLFDEGFDIIVAFRDLLAAGAFAGIASKPLEGEQV